MSTSVGSLLSQQEYDPWGKLRTGGTSITDLNYTGQRKDGTGLLYYHARYYDPSLARFVSPDSIVPGASSGVGGAGGSVGSQQTSKLTVDFRESGFLSSVKEENRITLQKGFWFQISSDARQMVIEPWGPINPQALNRYGYVLNNPLRYTDPTGHWLTTWIYNSKQSKIPRGFTVTFSRNEIKQLLDLYADYPNTLVALAGAGGTVATAGLIAAGMTGFPAVILGAILGVMTVYELERFMNFVKEIYEAGGTIEVTFDIGLLLFDRKRFLITGVTDKERANSIPDGPNEARRHLGNEATSGSSGAF